MRGSSRGLINWNKRNKIPEAFKGMTKNELKQVQGSSTAQLTYSALQNWESFRENTGLVKWPSYIFAGSNAAYKGYETCTTEQNYKIHAFM